MARSSKLVVPSARGPAVPLVSLKKAEELEVAVNTPRPPLQEVGKQSKRPQELRSHSRGFGPKPCSKWSTRADRLASGQAGLGVSPAHPGKRSGVSSQAGPLPHALTHALRHRKRTPSQRLPCPDFQRGYSEDEARVGGRRGCKFSTLFLSWKCFFFFSGVPL